MQDAIGRRKNTKTNFHLPKCELWWNIKIKNCGNKPTYLFVTNPALSALLALSALAEHLHLTVPGAGTNHDSHSCRRTLVTVSHLFRFRFGLSTINYCTEIQTNNTSPREHGCRTNHSDMHAYPSYDVPRTNCAIE